MDRPSAVNNPGTNATDSQNVNDLGNNGANIGNLTPMPTPNDPNGQDQDAKY